MVKQNPYGSVTFTTDWSTNEASLFPIKLHQGVVDFEYEYHSCRLDVIFNTYHVIRVRSKDFPWWKVNPHVWVWHEWILQMIYSSVYNHYTTYVCDPIPPLTILISHANPLFCMGPLCINSLTPLHSLHICNEFKFYCNSRRTKLDCSWVCMIKFMSVNSCFTCNKSNDGTDSSWREVRASDNSGW